MALLCFDCAPLGGSVTVDERIKKSRAQEKRTSKELGAQQHSRSGAGHWKKNDAHTDTELIEYKRTDNQKQITFRVKEFTELEHRALQEGRIPVFVVEVARRSFVILGMEDYQELRGQ